MDRQRDEASGKQLTERADLLERRSSGRQRQAMIVAAADLIGDRDTARLSAAAIVRRADTTPADFLRLFTSVEDCMLAAFDEGLQRATAAVSRAVSEGESLLVNIERGLEALLAFVEREPGWAHVLLVELPVQARTRRARAIRAIAELLSNARVGAPLDPDCPPTRAEAETLTHEVLDVIVRHMTDNKTVALVRLAPVLMSTIVEPHLAWPQAGGQQAVLRRWCVARGDGLTRDGVATRILEAVGQTPGASNREVVLAVGVANDGQTSAYLRRLDRAGLIRNCGDQARRGARNAWILTDSGRAALASALTGTPAAAA